MQGRWWLPWLSGGFLVVASVFVLLSDIFHPYPNIPPSLVGQEVAHVEGVAFTIQVQGTTVYMGMGARVWVLQGEDVSHLQKVGESPRFSGDVLDFEVKGRYLFVAARDAGIRVLDVADPAHPREVGGIYPDAWVEGIYLAGDRLYAASTWGGLFIFDVSRVPRMSLIGRLDTPGYARDVAVSEPVALVADWHGGTRVVDVSDPGHPREVAALTGETRPQSVAIQGHMAYVADGWGLQVIDVSDPAIPRVLKRLMLPGWTVHVVLQGARAYVSARDAGVFVVDISDPARAHVVGRYAVDAPAVHVVSVPPYLYVAEEMDGLLILRERE